MVNRELIRRKIVQLTYAYYQNRQQDIETAEKELVFSLSKAYDLYNVLLALIVAIHQEECHRVDILTQRAMREGTEIPSTKFTQNRFACQLEENNELHKFLESQNQIWQDDIELVRQLCHLIEESNTYYEYMSDPESSYEADREVWRRLYKQLIQENAELEAILEERSIYWNDDKEVVDTFVLKTIKRFRPENGADQPLLPQFKDDEDLAFAKSLFRATILEADTYQQYMSDASQNWDFSRLAYMDVVIMQIAIAEMMTFPNIPISVTINEYVDLAKDYSTQKSSAYINGMLDAIAHHLVKTGKLMKQLRPMERNY